ncbi:hypothetical protein [Enterococcus rivorum]|uniref:Uncharacterized protein n=1 Tax=Enterococcus rivorum TaxID=762845 RepID=A0A1E5KZ49_9ENTE|nr:hypothetical protein [Enterococcus rivorum]MBP2097700.1 hypothetical protein [Enterococcus rivorum]OEH83135.1 hypothetical protein BCR26_02380 [Enterococcus rivorum]
MINYTFKQWKYNEDSLAELIILFPEKKYVGLEELLNTEGVAFSLEDILNKIDLVISGVSQLEEIGTERSLAEIRLDITLIYDLFEELVSEEDINPTVEIPTLKLKEIIQDYQKIEEFDEKTVVKDLPESLWSKLIENNFNG